MISITNKDNIPYNGLKKRIIGEAAKKAGIDASSLSSAIQTGNIDSLMSNMKPDAASKLKSLLGNKEAAKKILSSPEARELMKKLSEQE